MLNMTTDLSAGAQPIFTDALERYWLLSARSLPPNNAIGLTRRIDSFPSDNCREIGLELDLQQAIGTNL
jgi:hypothetical protein